MNVRYYKHIHAKPYYCKVVWSGANIQQNVMKCGVDDSSSSYVKASITFYVLRISCISQILRDFTFPRIISETHFTETVFYKDRYHVDFGLLGSYERLGRRC